MSATSDVELAAALDALYVVFAAPKPARVDGCPCCLDRKNICTLLSKRLRELTADDLAPYAASAFLTVGEVRDFRYFLPRLLELSVTELDWWPSEEVLLSKLPLATWRSWLEPEQAVIEQVLRAWFAAILRSGLDVGWRIDALVCGLARAGVDTAPYLERLLEPANLPALVDFQAVNAAHLAKKGELINAFWDQCQEGAAAVIGFLQRPDVRSKVEDWWGSR